ncbi:glycosyltransferase family 4 protein [Rubinisphaera italica]|uniref:Alpha-galactosylglucosyldiacylglycerol synthase n=1 Tax=Rubinisphaera italica TaxID=2527969 RepID=A0A5C5X9Y6_9PLAN|nr:glycosyltransferase family 4 protein [Rubinisphaera italica]TWT59604.1 Alpha-galactosylglucosyldiacylglycerol synthase [Rubinisphaera italica]
MRVLLVHQAFVSPGQGGGTRHYEMACRLVKRGYDFTVVASDTNYLDGIRKEGSKGLVSKETIDGINVLRAYTIPTYHRSFVWRVVSFLSFMVTSVLAGLSAGKADLVIGTTPPIFQAVSAWILSVIRRCPFLLEVRDLWPEFAVNMGVLKNPVLIWMARQLESFLYARASHILVNSPAYQDYLLSKGIKAEKISVIPNGVDPEMFNSSMDTRDIRKELNLENKFIATYAGALGMANDIDTILHAASMTDAPEIHYLIVGDGKERPRLQQLAKELNLTNLTFTGGVAKQEMSAYLTASNVCLATLQDIPMFKTVYPNKVFDYMAAGRPVILGIDGVIREVLESANGGVFIHPGKPEELRKAVMAMAVDPQISESMGKSGQDYVTLHFNRDNHAEDLHKLLNKVSRKAA